MKLTTLAAVAASVAMPFAVASAAHAEDEKGSVEIGYTSVNFDSSPDLHLSAIHARGGMRFGRYVGAELEGQVGLGEESVHAYGYSVRVKEQWAVGAFAVAYLPVGHDIDLLARVGMAGAKIKASGYGVTAEDNGSGGALGVGARFFPEGNKSGFRVDYTRFYYSGEPVNAFSVSFVRKF